MSETKLYVGNLSDDASVEALRKRFSDCGNVTDVHLATDRSSGRMRGYAFITMATPADARSAISQLNGAMFDDRPLRVSEAGDQSNREPGTRGSGKAAQAKVRITSQFRERHNMTYEIDCDGTGLIFRIFPTPTETGGEEWRIEATAKTAPDVVVMASAATRALALDEVARLWAEKAAAESVPPLDWTAVGTALLGVRAI
jgi:RNA recognition motif-containing protein